MAKLREAKDALARRIAPATSLTLEYADDAGSKTQRVFRLSFDFNAFALVYDRTGIDMANKFPFGNPNPTVISVMLWAAVLACHPEFEGDAGLAVIRSYMDAGNVDEIENKLFDAWIQNMPEERKKFWLGVVEDVKKGLERSPDPTQAAQAEQPGPLKSL